MPPVLPVPNLPPFGATKQVKWKRTPNIPLGQQVQASCRFAASARPGQPVEPPMDVPAGMGAEEPGTEAAEASTCQARIRARASMRTKGLAQVG
jgi:hypothetical protein